MNNPVDTPAIKAALAKMTPGPWRSDWQGTNHFEITSDAPSGSYWIVAPNHNCCDDMNPRWDAAGHDLDGITLLRNTASSLVEEVERLRERVAQLEAECVRIEINRDSMEQFAARLLRSGQQCEGSNGELDGYVHRHELDESAALRPASDGGGA